MLVLNYSSPIANKLVPRLRILCDLFNITDSLVVFSAGPGYGKTTVLQQLTHESPERKTINLRAEAGDSFPDFISCLLKELNYSGDSISIATLTSVVEELKTSVLVTLDDFHQLIWDSDSLISLINLPKQIQFVFSGRSRPELWSNSWRLTDHLKLYTERDFSLDLQEVEDLVTCFLNSNYPNNLTRKLHTSTKGWPIAVFRYLNEFRNTSGLDDINREMLNLVGLCFDTEVLAHLSKKEQYLVTQTAFIKELRADLCHYITEDNHIKDTLESLYNQNLFVYKSEQGMFEYHPLFQEYLRDRAKLLHGPIKNKESCFKIANWYHEHEDDITAIEYYLLAGKLETAENLLSEFGLSNLSQGQDLQILKAMNDIATPELRNLPHLLFYRAKTLIEQGKWEAALSILETIEEVCCRKGICSLDFRFEVFATRALLYIDLGYIEAALEAIARIDQLELSNRAKARIANLYARCFWLSNNWQQAKDKAEEALQYFRMADDAEGEAIMLNDLAAVFYEPQGNFYKALTYFEESYKIRRKLNLDNAAIPLANMANIYNIQGNNDVALQLLSEAEFLSLENQPQLSLILMFLAQVYRDQGDYEKAKKLFEKALSYQDRQKQPWRVAGIYLGLSILSKKQGDLNNAIFYANLDLEIIQKLSNKHMLAQTYINLAHIEIAQNNLMKAQDYLLQAKDCYDTWQSYYELTRIELALAYIALETNPTDFKKHCNKALTMARHQNYAFELEKEPSIYVPVLLEALKKGLVPDFITSILNKMNYTNRHLTNTRPPLLTYAPEQGIAILTLGDFQIFRNLKIVKHSEWKRKKALTLLKMLVALPKNTVSLDTVQEYLWPDLNQDNLKSKLRVILHNLRLVLDPCKEDLNRFISYNGENILLLTQNIVIDETLFKQLARDGHEELRQGNWYSAQQLLQSASSLYNGPFLPDDTYQDWAALRREQLQSIYIEVLSDLAYLAEREANRHKAINIYKQLLDLEPTREGFHRKLMELYYLQNEQSLAIEQYALCRQTLKDSFGVNPLPETIQLYEKILNRD